MKASLRCVVHSSKVRRLLTVIFAAVVAAAGVGVGQPIPAGKSQFTVTIGDKSIQVYGYRPTNYAGGPLFVIFHGMLRTMCGPTTRVNATGNFRQAEIAALNLGFLGLRSGS